MSLNDIASKIDATLSEAEQVAEERAAVFVEHDASRMAHHIVAYVLERAEDGHDPYELGQTMVQGAYIGEDESGGFLAKPVIKFLESVLEGAQDALQERYGADNIVYDPVEHCVQYYLSHNRWPESATPGTISKAKAALAKGQRGSDGGAAMGTFL